VSHLITIQSAIYKRVYFLKYWKSRSWIWNYIGWKNFLNTL